MKVSILDIGPEEEEEIIVKCHQLDEHMVKLLKQFRQGNGKINVYQNGSIHLLEADEIYYFESVDQKVFTYTKQQVYEIKKKLYELEKELPEASVLRASKSTVLNLNKIKSLSPAFGGRFEALLKNGEKIIISRQYVSVLKEKLGL